MNQAKKWHDAGIAMPVSINLSARMLDDNDIPKYLMKALNSHKLPASCVTLELTETVVMSNIEQARKVFRILHKMGIKSSIDDFGVGFTSLKYLQELEVSEIKIDKAFTANLDKEFRSEIIIQSIAMLAKGLNTSIVVEGIEDIGLLQNCIGSDANSDRDMVLPVRCQISISLNGFRIGNREYERYCYDFASGF